jgi:hypothetical protein
MLLAQQVATESEIANLRKEGLNDNDLTAIGLAIQNRCLAKMLKLEGSNRKEASSRERGTYLGLGRRYLEWQKKNGNNAAVAQFSTGNTSSSGSTKNGTKSKVDTTTNKTNRVTK